MFEEIRNIVVEQGKRYPDRAFHVISDLNWYRYLKQMESMLQFLPSSGKVLDIGCGWGQTTAMLSASCTDLEVIGIDRVEAESWIKLKEYGAQFVTCSVFALPFKNKFDAVISFGTMEHTGDEGKFLTEINRVTKAGGCLIIFNLPNKYAISEHLAKILGIYHHERKYTLVQVKELLKAGGFSINTIRREFIVPAQVHRIGRRIGNLFNKYYPLLNKLDSWLMRTPLAYFAENWAIYAKKS